MGEHRIELVPRKQGGLTAKSWKVVNGDHVCWTLNPVHGDYDYKIRFVRESPFTNATVLLDAKEASAFSQVGEFQGERLFAFEYTIEARKKGDAAATGIDPVIIVDPDPSLMPGGGSGPIESP